MRAEALKGRGRKAIRIFGWILSLLAIAFFARLLVRQGLAINSPNPLESIAIVISGGAVYGLLVTGLAMLWSLIATPADRKQVRLPLCAAYLKSQAAKYIPGNVFQYVARHVLGRQLDLAHGALVSAAIMEALLLVLAATVIVIGFGQDALRSLVPGAPSISAWLALPVALLVPALAAWVPRPRPLQWIPRYRFGVLLAATLGYLVFFAGFGSIYAYALDWATGQSNDKPGTLVCSALAWLLGFVIPGAPAGAGMRESALALAGGSGPNVLSAILMFRLITMLGDFTAFILGLLLSARLKARNLRA